MNRAEASLARALDAAPAAGPAFAARLRRSGAEDFRRLLLPTTRHEDWLYTSLAGLAELELAPAAPARATAAEVARLAGLPPAPRLVLVNGRLDPALTDLTGLPPGAAVGGLAALLRDRPALAEPHFGRGPLPAHALAGLNAALFEDGAAVILPDGAALEAPLQVVHLTLAGAGPAAAFPRVLVAAGRDARALIVERFGGEGAYLSAGVTELALGAGAAVEHVRLQREAADAFHVGVVGVTQGPGSRFTSRSVALGGKVARVELRILLAGEEAECHLDGLAVAVERQVHDHFVHVDHAVPRCASRELFKGILDGHGRGVFTGRVLVRPDAQKSDAGQVNANLLLSEDATVDTRPQLEIFADDVKCSHGGTVGQLDEDALFYLRARGLDRATARALLTWAFAAELVERLPAPLRDEVRRAVTLRLPGGAGLGEAA